MPIFGLAQTRHDLYSKPHTRTTVNAASTSNSTAKEAGPADAAALASAGLWYDAVDVASQTERAALLDQVGLAFATLR